LEVWDVKNIAEFDSPSGKVESDVAQTKDGNGSVVCNHYITTFVREILVVEEEFLVVKHVLCSTRVNT
jgi:hypothetical protein